MWAVYTFTVVLNLVTIVATLVWASLLYWLGNFEARAYAYELAMSVDQHFNGLAGGDRDLTLSQQICYKRHRGLAQWNDHLLIWCLNLIFMVVIGERDHVRNSTKGRSRRYY